MDPVTGLSRRQLIILALLVPLGIIASTAATIVSERAAAACPDETRGCTVLHAGEPVVVALVDASDTSVTWPFEDVLARGVERSYGGRAARLDLVKPRCSVEAAAEEVREIAADPPGEPPATLVIAAACERALAPIAAILSDRGIPLILLHDVAPIPTDPPYALLAEEPDLEGQAVGVQAIGLASHLRELLVEHIGDILDRALSAIDRVAVGDGDSLLIPRSLLRDELISDGFSRV